MVSVTVFQVSAYQHSSQLVYQEFWVSSEICITVVINGNFAVAWPSPCECSEAMRMLRTQLSGDLAVFWHSIWTRIRISLNSLIYWCPWSLCSKTRGLFLPTIPTLSHQNHVKITPRAGKECPQKPHLHFLPLFKKKINNVISKFFYNNKYNGFGQVLGQGGWKLFCLTPDESTGCWLPLRKLLFRTEEWRRDWTPQEKDENKELPVSGKCQACGFCREAGFVSEKAGVSPGDQGAS